MPPSTQGPESPRESSRDDRKRFRVFDGSGKKSKRPSDPDGALEFQDPVWERMSEEARFLFRRFVNEYKRALRSMSLSLADRQRAEKILRKDVERAKRRLQRRSDGRLSKLKESLGGAFLGGAISYLVATWGETLGSSQIAILVLMALVGAFLVGWAVAED